MVCVISVTGVVVQSCNSFKLMEKRQRSLLRCGLQIFPACSQLYLSDLGDSLTVPAVPSAKGDRGFGLRVGPLSFNPCGIAPHLCVSES